MNRLYGLPDPDEHAALAAALARAAAVPMTIDGLANIADPADGVIWQLSWSGGPTIDTVLDHYERIECTIAERPRRGDVTVSARVDDRRGRRLRLLRAAG